MEETLACMFTPYSKFEFSFPVTCFKNCPSQFLSHWESAEPVFCNDELRSLPTLTKARLLSYLVGKIKFVYIDNFTKAFLQPGNLY